MTEKTIKPVVALAKEAIASDAEGLKALMRAAFQEVLEAEMTEALGAAKGERTGRRLGYRSGYYDRDLITRIDMNPWGDDRGQCPRPTCL